MRLGGGSSALALGLVLASCAWPVLAQSPFGVGAPETVAAPPSDGILRWIADQQSAFYQQLTATVRAMKENGSAVWILMGLSFLYGILHAAGPGHGKVIMASYVLANNETAKRGALLCFLSSMVQATVAVLLISVFAIALNATSLVIDQATRILELGSYAMIAGLGLYLLHRAVKQLRQSFWPDLEPHHHHHHSHDHHGDDHHHHDHEHGPDCGCGHDHAPAPELADQAAQSLARGDVKSAAMAVISVGLRPCTGALIVLVFALAQDLFWAGVLSAFAMGVGTAITVIALMFLAVGTRRVALITTGGNTVMTTRVLGTIQLLAAIAVLALGVLLLRAALL